MVMDIRLMDNIELVKATTILHRHCVPAQGLLSCSVIHISQELVAHLIVRSLPNRANIIVIATKKTKEYREDHAYCDDPPEIVSTCPLTQPPSSDARKATTLATSSGTAHLPSGQWFAIKVSIFSAGQSGEPPGM
jgi:hypothetical protein